MFEERPPTLPDGLAGQTRLSAQALTTAIRKAAIRHKPADWPIFTYYAWDNFSPLTVICLLTTDLDSYEGHKDILFSSLCTWSVCPKGQNSLRKHGMVLTGLQQILRVERLGREAFKHTNIEAADQIARIFGISNDFYTDFFYPIGGSNRLIHNISLPSFRRMIETQSRPVRTIVIMMSIMDFYAKRLGSDRFYSLSLRKIAEIVEAVFRSKRAGAINRDNAEKVWRNLFESASLAYAASTINQIKGRSLLDDICEGKATYSMYKSSISQWIARSRYVADIILGCFTDPRFAKANNAYLPDVENEATPEPQFSESEQEAIANTFDKKLILEKRGKTERTRRIRCLVPG